MNITWLNTQLAVSPQIMPADINGLKEMGFRSIINNRPDNEAPDQPASEALEREAVRLGLQYAYMPVVPGEITSKEAAAFDQLVSEADGPVLAFCRTGNRSGQLWSLARQLAPNFRKI
jgi:uncharacterized protein (TIGR01244 family)